MSSRPLIVLSLDGFVPSSLGCYGSSWSDTPTIDAMASKGVTWDRCISHHADPLENLRQWLGVGQTTPPAWMDRWRQCGSIEFLTDSQPASSVATKSQIDQLYLIDQVDEDSVTPAADVESTQFAQLIAGAVERIQDPDPLGVLWLHSDFLTKCWDAPRWLIDVDIDEELEEPVDEVELLSHDTEAIDSVPDLPAMFDSTQPPRVQLDEFSNPDLIMTWMTTYACQIRLVDELFRVLTTAAEQRQPALVLCGTSGFSHGQNGWIGHAAGPLRSCHLKLPLIVSHPAHSNSLRCRQLMNSRDLGSLLARVQGVGVQGVGGDRGESLITPEQWSKADGEFEPTVTSVSSAGDRAVTSSKWFFVRQENEVEHLYLKPDDAEDTNDVCRLRNDVVETLEKHLG